MNVNEFAREVHANAVSHGWWDDPRPDGEVMALIHSEWSEALEEARAGRPLVYYVCADCESGPCTATPDTVAYVCGFDRAGRKPEGIAVELADGCIRILDFITHAECSLNREHNSLERLCESVHPSERHLALGDCVARLHWYVSMAYLMPEQCARGRTADEIAQTKVKLLYMALAIACIWINENGGDAEKIMLEKHEYNKTRPYKHGKKF